MILELGTDLADSKKFKKIMLSRHGGRDLTPRCTYPNTKSGDLTHLNQVPQSAWKDKRIQKWMKDFVSARPNYTLSIQSPLRKLLFRISME